LEELLASSDEEPLLEPLIPEDVSLELPAEPLIPDGLLPVEDDPLVPVPLPERESELPDVLLPEVPELLLPELDPVEPDDMMSSFFTLSVSPEPEKLARTCTPSLMSSREARLPSFITSVLESTLRVLSLPESVRVLFERSKLWTRPCSE
jgi:hypothetical protein